MQCLPYTNHDYDIPFFIPKDKFLTLFDQSDFMRREYQEVRHEYRSDWFIETTCSEVYFILPIVQFINKRTQFINGRHRTAVLLNYLDFIPLALVHPFGMDQYFLNQIINRPIKIKDLIDLPNLPILEE